MKHVVSVSIGSSRRNKRTEQEFLGEKVVIERIGTDGSIDKAIEIIRRL
ncbi:MAG TPA: quinate 5-dehydrogenase, partial [Firmicutes bacterium]|nr:quinate 5-dehydrogenase [Bacillota bacterium]